MCGLHAGAYINDVRSLINANDIDIVVSSIHCFVFIYSSMHFHCCKSHNANTFLEEFDKLYSYLANYLYE